MTIKGDEVLLCTQMYWHLQNMGPRFDSVSASLGLRFGMVVAMAHPEYAQAYIQLTGHQEADPLEEKAISGFVEAVPVAILEGDDNGN